MPAQLLPARSWITPEATVTEYAVPYSRSRLGLTVTVEPLKLTCDVSVTEMVAMVVPPRVTIKLPVPALTASLKVRTKLVPIAISVAPSMGLALDSNGAVVSAEATVVKSYVVVPA